MTKDKFILTVISIIANEFQTPKIFKKNYKSFKLVSELI